MITCRNNVRLEIRGGEHLEPFARKKLAELKAMRKQNRFLPNNRNIISADAQIYLEDNDGRTPDLIRIQGIQYGIYSYNLNDNLYDALFTDNQDSIPLVVNGMADGFMRESPEHGNVLCRITLKTCYGPLNPVAAFHFDGTKSFYQSQLDNLQNPMKLPRWRFVKRFFSRSRERDAVFRPLFVSQQFAVAMITDSADPASKYDYDYSDFYGTGRPNQADVKLSGNRCFALRNDSGDRVYLEAIAAKGVFRSAVIWRGEFPDADGDINIQIPLPEKERERFINQGLIRYAAWSVRPWIRVGDTWDHDNPDGSQFGSVDSGSWSSVFGWEYGVFERREEFVTIQPYNNDKEYVPPVGQYVYEEGTSTINHGFGWAQRATLYCRGEQVFANTVPLSYTETRTIHANYDSRYEKGPDGHGIEVRDPDEYSDTTITSGSPAAVEWRVNLQFLDEKGRQIAASGESTIATYYAREETATGSMVGGYGVKPDGLLHSIARGDVVEVKNDGTAKLIVPQPAIDDPQDDHLFSLRKLHRDPKQDQITLVKVVPEEIEKHIEPRYWMALLFRGKYPRQFVDGTEFVRVTEDGEKPERWVQVVWLQNVLVSDKAGTVVVRNDLLPSEELPYFVAFCLYAKRTDQSKKHFLIAEMPFVH